MSARIAILDLNNGTKNLGLRSIVEIVASFTTSRPDLDLTCEVFDVRQEGLVPDLEFDAFISTGGPGSPFEGEGSAWEKSYFEWIRALWFHNEAGDQTKQALFVCHSFELLVRFFDLAQITERKSPSFGIYPVHLTSEGRQHPVLKQLDDPFVGADFREWQVVEPDLKRLAALDATIVALEKERPNVPLDRAVMGLNLGKGILGLQFHPEASPDGMALHFSQEERKKMVIEEHGIETYRKMIAVLERPDLLEKTYATVIPKFLDLAFSTADQTGPTK